MSQLSDIWGAKDTDKPEPVETIHQKFERGVRAGKLMLVKEIEEFFLEKPQCFFSESEVCEILECTSEELNNLMDDKVDAFDLDRLPAIVKSLRRYQRVRAERLAWEENQKKQAAAEKVGLVWEEWDAQDDAR